jgi:dTDP-4-amino-4,6-dideoxygalactose transaminase
VLRHLLCRPRDSIEIAGRLEAEICRRFDVGAAVCAPMARTALYFTLREMIRPGQSVVMSPLTIVDVVNMVLLAGGVPVFADICRTSCAVDPNQVESLIDARAGAVLITHLHGETAGAFAFQDICRRHGVPLIEDAAQAFGAAESGRRLGTIGDVGIYSFGFYKNLNAWQGGMLVSQNRGLADRIRRQMNQCRCLAAHHLLALTLRGLLTEALTWPPLFASLTARVIRYSELHGVGVVTRRMNPEFGQRRLPTMPKDYLGNMTVPQAMIALRNLDRVDSDTVARIANAARYHRSLSELDGLILPRCHEGPSHIYTYYPIQFHNRDALLRYGMLRRRDFAAQHLFNCADLPEFSEFYRDCPNARAAARELILLPTYPRYPATEIEKNIEVIRDYLHRKGWGLR